MAGTPVLGPFSAAFQGLHEQETGLRAGFEPGYSERGIQVSHANILAVPWAPLPQLPPPPMGSQHLITVQSVIVFLRATGMLTMAFVSSGQLLWVFRMIETGHGWK